MNSANRTAFDALERSVSSALTEHDLSGKRLLVAVSGGPDSMALLHALSRLRNDFGLNLFGAHLNHNLRGAESDADAAFAVDVFRRLNITFSLDSADVAEFRRRHRLSLEDAARRVRYAFLADAADEHDADAIALGHTTDDQAETVLMHIIRGSGLDGMRGMQILNRRCINGKTVALFRPLLNVSRAQTQAYCDALGLNPRIDKSNSSPEFLRNRIRLELVPLLEQLNPSVQDALMRLSQNATQDSDFIRELGDAVWDDVSRLENSVKGEVVILDTTAMGREQAAIQGYVLRRGIAVVGGEVTQRHVLDMMRLLRGAPGKTLNLSAGLTFATGYSEAYIGNSKAIVEVLAPIPVIRGESTITVPGKTQVGDWIVRTQVQTVGDGYDISEVRKEGQKVGEAHQALPNVSEVLDLDCLGEKLRIRGRRPGDRFQPLGMEGSKSLREFMIDARIPQSWRDGLPLLVSERGVVCVLGWRIAHWARITDATRRVLRLGISYGGTSDVHG